jgi:hypothetical protein
MALFSRTISVSISQIQFARSEIAGAIGSCAESALLLFVDTGDRLFQE